MKRLLWLSAVLLCSVALLVPGTATAGIVTYIGFDDGVGGPPHPLSDAAAAAFDAAAGGVSIITFESAPLGAYTSLDLGYGVTLTGMDVGGADQTIINSPLCDPALCGYNITTGGSQWADVYGGTITFTFSAPVNMFGAYFTGVQIQGINLSFFDGQQQSILVPAGSGGTAFVGFIDDNAFTSITFDGLNDIVGVDDVRAPVPEPGSIALLGAGLVSIAGLLRRKLF